MQRRQFLATAVAAAAAARWPAARAQQTLPSGPVRIVVGFPAGGGTDVLARLLAQKLAAEWGLAVIVENRAGAAGVIAADHVAKQAGDGNTLLMSHINSHGIAPGLQPKLAYTVEKDFTPIALVGKTPTILVGNVDQPAKTLPELVALCRSQPGKIIFGSAGTGSAQHLALEIFKARAGIDVLHVPYKGSAPLMTDLMGGHVHYAFEGMTTATPLIKSGKASALAQTLSKRSASHPDVPTVAEQGYAGFEASIWFGMDGPAGVPAPVADRINADIAKVLAMPDVVERLAQVGAEDGGGSRQRYADFTRGERQKYAEVIRQARIQPEG
ncbi:Bug family tripartite tricarboxylate transporter substrate binding protein [Bordetella genomosp. 13]|uniref:LacI family transcriptional regulator n=1 Tax=Bordetella genomosp. 13 TaxID=463040 RepID=A0A1W6ZI25_9BORD|nr:tripartite tricarboxylate transporter substrate binding protein [Bordetella genomosp. 13]ARP96494.1 LacI family transcriptional regulator [Bordetella genomosp. 13]